jgi:hypothetical protein
MQVRKAFEAGLGAAAPAGRDPAAFYLACADYIKWSMDRLHEQDQIIHDLLAERIPGTEKDAHERLAVLNARQRSSRELVAGFARATEQLRASGRAGVAAFEAAAREFTDTFKSLLQPRKNPFFRHTDELFRESDWVRIAGVSAASIAAEQELFGTVKRTAPPGSDPDTFTAEHLPG